MISISSLPKENYNIKALVEMWGDFVDWEKRREDENGFLKNTLDLHGVSSVFNSCLGDGCDSIYLIMEGFDVTSNEFDPVFLEKARENARKDGINLNTSSSDWRELDKHFCEGFFDSVICLGNSLTYLFTKSEQLNTLKQFRRLLRDEGTLIIDERNYQYFLDCKTEILKGNFRYSGKYIYCGKKVTAVPIQISDKKVVMEYSDSIRNKKAHLSLYPFKRGELLGLLKEAGFSKVEQYSDYAKGFNPKSDFYTYVCVK